VTNLTLCTLATAIKDDPTVADTTIVMLTAAG
jgi:hypothetical protein